MTKNWLLYRDKIIKLYQTEGMTLEKVREVMNQEHKFSAGTRTYRMYLKKWNVRKYKKHDNSQHSFFHRPCPPRTVPCRPRVMTPRTTPTAGATEDLPRGDDFSAMGLVPEQCLIRPWSGTEVFPASPSWTDRSSSVSASGAPAIPSSPSWTDRSSSVSALAIPDSPTWTSRSSSVPMVMPGSPPPWIGRSASVSVSGGSAAEFPSSVFYDGGGMTAEAGGSCGFSTVDGQHVHHGKYEQQGETERRFACLDARGDLCHACHDCRRYRYGYAMGWFYEG